jgi:hypothetical protein
VATANVILTGTAAAPNLATAYAAADEHAAVYWLDEVTRGHQHPVAHARAADPKPRGIPSVRPASTREDRVFAPTPQGWRW